MSDTPSLRVDSELSAKLRKDFTAKSCAEALMQSATEMAQAIGVEVSWQIVRVNEDKDVEKSELTKALGRLAAAGGAILMGGRVNPIGILKAQEHMQTMRNKGT